MDCVKRARMAAVLTVFAGAASLARADVLTGTFNAFSYDVSGRHDVNKLMNEPDQSVFFEDQYASYGAGIDTQYSGRTGALYERSPDGPVYVENWAAAVAYRSNDEGLGVGMTQVNSGVKVDVKGVHIENVGNAIPPDLGIEITVKVPISMNTHFHVPQYWFDELQETWMGASVSASFGAASHVAFGAFNAGGTQGYGAMVGVQENQDNQQFFFQLSQVYYPHLDNKLDFSLDVNLAAAASILTSYTQLDEYGYADIFMQTGIEFESRIYHPGPPGDEGYEYYLVSDDGVLTRDGFNRDLFVPTPGAAGLCMIAGLAAARRRR